MWGLFDGEEMGVLVGVVNDVVRWEKLNVYRYRVVVFCLGVDFFFLYFIVEVEVVIC